MNTARKLILSGALLSFAATGFALAQEGAPAANAPSAVEDGAMPPSAGTEPAASSAGEDRAARRAERRNRTVSQEQFGSRRLDRLEAADADGNGELSRAEIEDLVLRRMVERRANRMERRLDIDGDGTVTIAETQNHQAKRFAFLDRNEDGQLDRSELRRDRGKMGRHGRDRDRRHHHRDRGGERSGPRG